MTDKVLGKLRADKRFPDTLTGSIAHPFGRIELCIDPDGGALEDTLNLAREAVRKLAEIDECARQAACDNLLSTLNEGWRKYQESDGKGGWIVISKDPVGEEEFKGRLTLKTLEITKDDSCSLWYDDGDLFFGHSILVASKDGARFRDVVANLSG